jgi:DNA-binding Lrp family transcriptional regulator
MTDLGKALGMNPSGHFLAEPNRLLRTPSLVDWQIVDALIDDPKIPLGELAEAAGLSPKTVRKHLARLLDERTIRISPKLGSLAVAGDLVYTVSVFGNVGIADLRSIMGDVHLIKQFQHPPAKHLLCLGRDLGEVLGKIRALGKLSGVRVSVSLNREQLVATALVHSLVREQERRLGKKLTSSSKPYRRAVEDQPHKVITLRTQ